MAKKISWEWLMIGAAAGAIGAIMYSNKKTIPNAYALGQANPTTAYTSLQPAQVAQISGPDLPSPPSVAQQIANITQQTTQGTAV